MKIDRLIGILSRLQREQVTAFELAEKFEVSHHTIYGIWMPCAVQEFPS
ncbi:MAG: hypothetical protein ACLSTI_01410 [Ruminococcus sp.]